MVQRIQTEFIHIYRDLEYTVCRGIDDRFAGRFMLVAEHLNNLRAGCRIIAETFDADRFLISVHKFLWKAVWISLERHFCTQSRDLPMPCGRIFSAGKLRSLAEAAFRRSDRKISKRGSVNIAPAQTQEIRDLQSAAVPPNMSERVRARVAVLRRVRHRADAQTVCYDQNYFSAHLYTSFGFACR